MILYGETRVSLPERIPMSIPLDLRNIPIEENRKPREDLKEMLRILIAFIIMAIIFGIMLASVTVPEYHPQPAVREVIWI